MSPRCLLDTSAVIIPADPARFEPQTQYVISSITFAELYAGIHTATNPIERAMRIDRFEWLGREFVPLPFTSHTARKYGQLNAMTLAVGRNPRGRRMDLLIAASAAEHRIPLATYNAKDFIGLAPLVEVIDLAA